MQTKFQVETVLSRRCLSMVAAMICIASPKPAAAALYILSYSGEIRSGYSVGSSLGDESILPCAPIVINFEYDLSNALETINQDGSAWAYFDKSLKTQLLIGGKSFQLPSDGFGIIGMSTLGENQVVANYFNYAKGYVIVAGISSSQNIFPIADLSNVTSAIAAGDGYFQFYPVMPNGNGYGTGISYGLSSFSIFKGSLADAPQFAQEDGPVPPPITNGAVPEPSTWAMMIMGFGFVGFALRSRRQRMRTGHLAF